MTANHPPGLQVTPEVEPFLQRWSPTRSFSERQQVHNLLSPRWDQSRMEGLRLSGTGRGDLADKAHVVTADLGRVGQFFQKWLEYEREALRYVPADMIAKAFKTWWLHDWDMVTERKLDKEAYWLSQVPVKLVTDVAAAHGYMSKAQRLRMVNMLTFPCGKKEEVSIHKFPGYENPEKAYQLLQQMTAVSVTTVSGLHASHKHSSEWIVGGILTTFNKLAGKILRRETHCDSTINLCIVKDYSPGDAR